MSETNQVKYPWLTKLSVIGGSATISAFGSALLNFLILGGSDSAVVGLGLGFSFGFLLGGGVAMWLLGKQITIWRVIVVSTLVVFLISSLLATGFYFTDWSNLDLNIDLLSR
jgi:hypothetical protein